MTTDELKDYLKACIDCYQVLYEIPKIIEKIEYQELLLGCKIEDPIPLRFMPIEFDSCYNSCLEKIIDEEKLYPRKYTVHYEFKSTGKAQKVSYDGPVVGGMRFEERRKDFLDRIKKGYILSNSIVKIDWPLLYRKKYEDACQRAEKMAIKEQQDLEKAQLALINEENAKIQKVIANNEVTRKNNAQKKNLLENEHEVFTKNFQETTDDLRKLLDTNVIHEKYRDFACLCSLYDYIDTGRCNELTGPFGAYQRYEEDLVAGKIVNSLERIENKLDSIADNQRILAWTMVQCTKNITDSINELNATVNKEVSNLNKSINGLGNSVDKVNATLSGIKESTVATNYNIERIAKITKYVNSVRYAKGEFAGFEYSYPY